MTAPSPESDPVCFFLRDPEATDAMGAAIASAVVPGTRIYLSGDLGAGKTALSRALIRSLGYNGRVKSPTFTLVEPYKLSTFDLYHFDFYRFSSEEELREAGFEELIDSPAVVLVEWPEQAQRALPAPDLWLRLEPTDDPESRRLLVWAHGVRGEACLKAMRAAAG